jgi:mannose-6-phosphate isomerase-like protein (cupin superfamily)
MRMERANWDARQGWCVEPSNSDPSVSVGYANEGVDEPDAHRHVSEIYMVARGTSQLQVEGERIVLRTGDVALIEPDEAHTFLSSSPDYFRLVAHVPELSELEARLDKANMPRDRLGL